MSPEASPMVVVAMPSRLSSDEPDRKSNVVVDGMKSITCHLQGGDPAALKSNSSALPTTICVVRR